MSVRTITQVFDKSIHAGTELLMLIVLADYSDDEGNSYPAVASLARKCRMKPRNANYILKSLQESGELRVLKNEGPKGTNRYRIMLPALGTKPLQRTAPLQPIAPLQHSAPTPATQCAKPLQPIAAEPSLNRQEPSSKRTAAQTFVLPDWIPEDAWNGYVEMRTKIRSTMTTRAMNLKVSELERLRNIGQNIGDVLDKSTSNNWKDVYPLKSEGSVKPQSKPWEGAR